METHKDYWYGGTIKFWESLSADSAFGYGLQEAHSGFPWWYTCIEPVMVQVSLLLFNLFIFWLSIVSH